MYQFEGIDRIITSGGDDAVIGSAAAFNFINTNQGNDYVTANADRSVVRMGAGDDNIVGGAGVDIIDMGPGSDVVFTGAGRDVINFLNDPAAASGETILRIFDFKDTADKIKLGGGLTVGELMAAGLGDAENGGVAFTLATGDYLFVAGMTLSQFSAADFIV